MDGVTRGLHSARLVCHVLLIESDRGLILVDTGFGLRDVRESRPRLAEFFLDMLRPRFNESEAALRQVEALGFKREDVRHIVLTHLDFDHAGGIEDFPEARVHLLGAEFQAATHVRALIDVGRYRPAQWGDLARWRKYPMGGEKWFGFEAVRDLEGLPPDILLIPLVGHTWGHSGVAVYNEGRWLLHAGDAYFYRREIDWAGPVCPPGLRMYQRLMEVDRRMRLLNQRRLRLLNRDHSDEVKIFSSHDRVEFEKFIRPPPAKRRVRAKARPEQAVLSRGPTAEPK
jgi:glyoxylase-like metal-dependent hydrolase (beta-lactamase superfamily II)